MATTTPARDSQQAVALDLIHVPENVRALDPEHVHALAGSIALQGVLVPIVVRADGEKFELVAGFHRLAAARQLGLGEIPVVYRDAEQQDAARAIENIARKALSPYEEARAVRAMLDRGLSEDGAAQALGWPKVRVTARVKILSLPERAQEMIGSGQIPLSAVEQLRRIGDVAPKLLQAVISYLDGVDQWAADRLASEPGWVLGQAIRHGGGGVFAAYLNQVGAPEVAELRLGKKTDQLYAEAEKLHKQLTPYAYGPPPVRFGEQDVDEARAAGVLIELENSTPIVVDRSLYRELVKQTIKRTTGELRVKAAQLAEEKKQERKQAAQVPADPVAEANRERDRQLRELADQAHGINLDLGAGLLNGLSRVDPSDMDVARAYVYGLLGADYGSGCTQTGERIHHLAVAGIRLVVGELRADVTKTKKDGTPGRLRIDYGDPREPDAALKWLWRYLDAAKTAGDLYGRGLVVICAEQYAKRMVLPASQRTYRMTWASHKDLAAKALRKLAGPHIPASLEQLERAVAKANKQADDAQRQHRDHERAAAAGTEPVDADEPDREVDEDDVESGEDSEPDELSGDA